MTNYLTNKEKRIVRKILLKYYNKDDDFKFDNGELIINNIKEENFELNQDNNRKFCCEFNIITKSNIKNIFVVFDYYLKYLNLYDYSDNIDRKIIVTYYKILNSYKNSIEMFKENKKWGKLNEKEIQIALYDISKKFI
jgi:hypothetical protein